MQILNLTQCLVSVQYVQRLFKLRITVYHCHQIILWISFEINKMSSTYILSGITKIT
jgi:hypothetical protein